MRTHDTDVVVVGDGIDALYAPRRTVLDPLLAEAAATAGATVRFGFTVGQLLRDSDGRITGVLGTDRLGRITRIRARFVVGADGANSLVAKDVEAPIDKVGRGATSYLYRYWSDVETDGYDWLFRSGVAAGVIPTNDGLACVFVGSDAERVRSRAPDAYASLLVQASPDVADRVLAGRPHGRLRRFLGRPGLVRRPWGPGRVLVGDAGYWKDPISASTKRCATVPRSRSSVDTPLTSSGRHHGARARRTARTTAQLRR